MHHLRSVLTCLVIAAFASAGLAQTHETGHGGAAATVDERVTAAAITVLELGGNAIDATVAAAAALGVTEPFSGGIGGGGFMLIYLAETGQVISIDGRETAPMAATPDMFMDGDTALPFNERRGSSLSVGVPGTLAQWQVALDRYGTMDLGTLLQPAIRLAEDGFEVDETFASQAHGNLERFSTFPAAAELFLPDGAAPEVGSIHRNPDLAATYRLLAEEGINAFYRGEIGYDLVATVQSPATVDEPTYVVRSQDMTMADLDLYHAPVRAATHMNYRGYDIYGMGSPSSGGLTIGLILGMLQQFDLSEMSEAEALHHMIEASRLAYADRGAYMGDSDFVNVPGAGLQSSGFAAARAELIGDARSDGATPGNPFDHQEVGSPPLLAPQETDEEGISTSHITVADRHGNVVAYTSTIEGTGGSGMVVPGRGFLLNNELTDFNAAPGTANSVQPGKRPRSSMAPTIVLADGKPFMALGSPGGSTIITTVLQSIMNVIDFGMSPEEAIAAPRMSQQAGTNTAAEPGFTGELMSGLSELGHTFSESNEIGAATLIMFNDDGSMTAVAEPVRRGSGSARVVNPQ